MAIEVFNRYEQKYLLDRDVYDGISGKLAERMELDAYNKRFDTYTIANLYYDTPDSHLIRTSLAKPKYKEKLRLRAYGIPDMHTIVYAEIKKKVAGLTNKRRSALTLEEAYAFLQTGRLPAKMPCQNRQVLREIEYALQMYNLQSSLYLAYDRKAFFGIEEHDLRVSFDCNIRTRRTDLRLEAGDKGQPLLEEDQWLMEIKSTRSIPVWLCRLLSEYAVYPTSFSKYGKEYMHTIKNRQPAMVYSFVPARPALPLKTTAKA